VPVVHQDFKRTIRGTAVHNDMLKRLKALSENAFNCISDHIRPVIRGGNDRYHDFGKRFGFFRVGLQPSATEG